MMGSGAAHPRSQQGWLSPNPDKAWAERAFLLGSIAWIAAVAVVIFTGVLESWGDAGYLLFSLSAAATVTVAPLLLRPKDAKPLFQSYFFKLNLFAFVLVFFGTYFGTHYFFDLMGMRYAFPTRFVFEAAVVGKSGAHVPVFMYPLTQAYFVTYFTVLVILDRGISAKLGLGRVGRAVLVLLLAYVIAFLETLFMANDLMKALFSYANKTRMLWLGSIGYAVYFVVGLPAVRDVDENESAWSAWRVLVQALAASMAILILLEAWAKLVGPL
jgi:cycloeucalenol cycloisomerase